MMMPTEEDKEKLKEFEAQIADVKAKSESWERDHEAEIETAWKAWAATNPQHPDDSARLDPWQAVGPSLPPASMRPTTPHSRPR